MSNRNRWTLEILMNHPKRDSLLGVNTKIQQPSIAKEPEKQISAPAPQSLIASTVNHCSRYSFVVAANPMGKPRQTHSDIWKKRPVVIRYRKYCDQIRAASGKLPDNVYSIIVFAYIPMPESWPKKKRAEMNGQFHRQKPDVDNICKGILDALFKDDSAIAGCCGWKFWCEQKQEHAEIHVLYLQDVRSI